MFGIGGTEFLVIMVVALLVLGPKKLPELARTLGKFVGEFRRVSTEFQRNLNTEVAFEESRQEHEARKVKAAENPDTAAYEDTCPTRTSEAQGTVQTVEPDARTGRTPSAADKDSENA